MYTICLYININLEAYKIYKWRIYTRPIRMSYRSIFIHTRSHYHVYACTYVCAYVCACMCISMSIHVCILCRKYPLSRKWDNVCDFPQEACNMHTFYSPFQGSNIEGLWCSLVIKLLWGRTFIRRFRLNGWHRIFYSRHHVSNFVWVSRNVCSDWATNTCDSRSFFRRLSSYIASSIGAYHRLFARSLRQITLSKSVHV